MKNVFLILTLYLTSGLETLLPDPDMIEVVQHKSPEITFQINPNDTSIVLEQIKMPKSTRVYFLLSSSQREMNWRALIQDSLNPKGAEKGMVVDRIEKDQKICFEQLKSQATYYLYYFSEDNETKEKSQIIRTTIEVGSSNKVKENNLTSSYELFNADFFRTMASVCIPAFMIYFISLFLQKMDQVPDECFSLNTNRETMKADDEKVSKIVDVSSRSFFRLFHRRDSTGRQEEEEEVKICLYKSEKTPSSQRIEDENQELEERRVCGICCQRSREIIFLNCGHAYCCYVCSLRLTVCPFDQKPICTRLRFSMARNYETECYSNELAASLRSSSQKTMEKIEDSDSDREVILKLQNSFLQKLIKCVVCDQKNKDAFFLNCGHLVCCRSCAENLTTCPFDNIPITKMYQAYFP